MLQKIYCTVRLHIWGLLHCSPICSLRYCTVHLYVLHRPPLCSAWHCTVRLHVWPTSQSGKVDRIRHETPYCTVRLYGHARSAYMFGMGKRGDWYGLLHRLPICFHIPVFMIMRWSRCRAFAAMTSETKLGWAVRM